MPYLNYCDNDLIVSGKKKDVMAFVELAGNGGETCLDFNAFVPYPQQYLEMDNVCNERLEMLNALCGDERRVAVKLTEEPRSGYEQGGRQWCDRNWGTHMNVVYSKIVRQTNRSVNIRFDTVENPADRIVKAMSLKFPSLSFTLRYYFAASHGRGYKGLSRVKSGEELRWVHDGYSGTRGRWDCVS